MRLFYFLPLFLMLSCGEPVEENNSGGNGVGGIQELLPDDFLSFSEKDNLDKLCRALESKEFFISRSVVSNQTELRFQLKRKSCVQDQVQTLPFSSRVTQSSNGLELVSAPPGAIRYLFTKSSKLISNFCEKSLVGDVERFQKLGNDMLWLHLSDKSSEGCIGRDDELCAFFTSGTKVSRGKFRVNTKESILVDIDDRNSSRYGAVLVHSYESSQLCNDPSDRDITEQTFLGF